MVLVFAISGCIYKTEIRQGDDTLPAKIEELRIGMTRHDVLALLGKSLTETLFRDNTWIYYYNRRSDGFEVSWETLGVEIIFDDNDKITEINRLSGEK